MKTERFLTVEEVAEVLRISRWSVGRYIKSGALKAVKADGPNGAVRVPEESGLGEYLRAHTVTARETR